MVECQHTYSFDDSGYVKIEIFSLLCRTRFLLAWNGFVDYKNRYRPKCVMNEFWQIYPVYCRKYICLVGLYFQLLWIFYPSRLAFVGWSQGKTKLWRLWLNVLKSTETENSITNSPFLWRNLNNIPHYLQIFTKSLFVLSFDVVLLRYFTIKFPKCFVITHNIYYVVCENLVIRSSLNPTNHSHILACTYFFDLSVKCENNYRFVFKEGVFFLDVHLESKWVVVMTGFVMSHDWTYLS